MTGPTVTPSWMHDVVSLAEIQPVPVMPRAMIES